MKNYSKNGYIELFSISEEDKAYTLINELDHLHWEETIIKNKLKRIDLNKINNQKLKLQIEIYKE